MPISHGDEMKCPNCGATGRYDSADPETPIFPDSIWTIGGMTPEEAGQVKENWECRNCYLR